ncbi:hypothetical protein AXJ18_gp152 [Streptomyces phage Jay2Jay]|uniref:Uncharacterized protein n=1 Tax=Streptomyces phage Jay2Jay TaxID=1556290 RepID=A0A0A0RQL0_9CAUD|nr:hypothetical protein AXJ18_gp152 [Streptomyces phage Jay2Jay]AIW02622.1 hypothetical protein PBI_JAY2JAY_134 [Streptomyces phage Jay2Jay]
MIAVLDRLLDMEGVEAVRWTQHTPSFNDGEPCRFGIGTASVKLKGFKVPEEGYETSEGDWYDEDEEVFLSEYDLYEYPKNEDGSTDWNGDRIYEIGGIPTQDIKTVLSQFESMLDSGAHYAWLMTSFGDPAEVTADATDFHVERYEGE